MILLGTTVGGTELTTTATPGVGMYIYTIRIVS